MNEILFETLARGDVSRCVSMVNFGGYLFMIREEVAKLATSCHDPGTAAKLHHWAAADS